MIEKEVLIKGADFNKIKEELSKGNKLQELISFFDMENFLITEYYPLSEMVHTIIKLDNGSIFQFEDCICGYSGTGTMNTIELLKTLGIEDIEIKKKVFSSDMLHIVCDEDGDFKYPKFEIEPLFYSEIRKSYLKHFLDTKIELSRDVRVDFKNRTITFINPTNENFIGLLSLLSVLQINYLEYYLGKESPLENHFVTSKLNKSYHVNLVLYSGDFRVICLIDKNKEIEFIETIYYILTNKKLFNYKEAFSDNIFSYIKGYLIYRKEIKDKLNEVQRVMIK